jgi:hypothetical protein
VRICGNEIKCWQWSKSSRVFVLRQCRIRNLGLPLVHTESWGNEGLWRVNSTQLKMLNSLTIHRTYNWGEMDTCREGVQKATKADPGRLSSAVIERPAHHSRSPRRRSRATVSNPSPSCGTLPIRGWLGDTITSVQTGPWRSFLHHTSKTSSSTSVVPHSGPDWSPQRPMS